MQDHITVDHVAVTITRDKLGNETREEWPAGQVCVLFAPRSSTERPDPSTPAVITGATLYGPPGWVVGTDDYFLVNGERWAVEGEAGGWGSMGTEVAITRWRSR